MNSAAARRSRASLKIELVRSASARWRPRLSLIEATLVEQKEQVKEAVQDLAAEMLRVEGPGPPGIYPTPWQREFEAEFYDETEDQLAAIESLKRDMNGPRPMDRLLCGDVGFGKTEVAIRAAFQAVEFGKQVAVLVPTTVLAEQHERTFAARFRRIRFAWNRFRLQDRRDQEGARSGRNPGQVEW